MGSQVAICVCFEGFSEIEIISIEQEFRNLLSPSDDLDCFMVIQTIQFRLTNGEDETRIFKKIGELISQHPDKIHVFPLIGPMYAGPL